MAAPPQAWAHRTPLLLRLCQQSHTEGQVGCIDALLTSVCRDVRLLFARRHPASTLFKTSAGAGVSVGSVKFEHEQQPPPPHHPPTASVFSLSPFNWTRFYTLMASGQTRGETHTRRHTHAYDAARAVCVMYTCQPASLCWALGLIAVCCLLICTA